MPGGRFAVDENPSNKFQRTVSARRTSKVRIPSAGHCPCAEPSPGSAHGNILATRHQSGNRWGYKGRQLAGGGVSWGRLRACPLTRSLGTGKLAARPTSLNPPYVCLRASCSREIYHVTEAQVEKKHHVTSLFGNICPVLAILRKKRKITEKACASYFLSISDGGGGD